jgi:hypothetical protein
MEIFYEALPEMIATLIGVVVGGVGALYIDSQRALSNKKKRAQIILHDIFGELEDNYHSLQTALKVYDETSYGKSFYISTIAWETATTGGSLPDIIGIELADIIENQYSILMSLVYYVDLMTRLWFAPDSIEGKKEMQEGFRQHILDGLQEAIEYHPFVIKKITETQKKLQPIKSK